MWFCFRIISLVYLNSAIENRLRNVNTVVAFSVVCQVVQVLTLLIMSHHLRQQILYRQGLGEDGRFCFMDFCLSSVVGYLSI